MKVSEAIAARRTHKRYTGRAVERGDIEALLEAAVLAPNHKMTEPWRFVVLGAAARRAYAELKAAFKCGAATADEKWKTAEKRAKIVAETLEVPAFIAVLMHEDEDTFRRDEDHAAVWMGVQNMLLAATERGLGTKIATGRLFEGDAVRALFRAGPSERVLGVVHIGEPAEERSMKPRTPVAEKTLWLD